MKETTAPDVAYNYVNTLYYQTRKNRFSGCNKDKLRKLLAITTPESEIIFSELQANGLVDDAGTDVLLTDTGWTKAQTGRRHKTHATVLFTGVTELPREREGSVFRFEYNLRDNAFRQYTQSVTVSISNEVCRKWGLQSFDNPVNNAALPDVLRRYAFDLVSNKLTDGTLRTHEHLIIGHDQAHACRYSVVNIPGTESLEYEVEWTLHSRA